MQNQLDEIKQMDEKDAADEELDEYDGNFFFVTCVLKIDFFSSSSFK